LPTLEWDFSQVASHSFQSASHRVQLAVERQISQETAEYPGFTWEGHFFPGARQLVRDKGERYAK